MCNEHGHDRQRGPQAVYRHRYRLPEAESRPGPAAGLRPAGGRIYAPVRPGGVAGGQRQLHLPPARGVLQRHLDPGQPGALGAVLGGGLRGGQLRPVPAPRLLPGPASVRPPAGHRPGPAVCRRPHPAAAPLCGGGRGGERERGGVCQRVQRGAAGAVRQRRPAHRPARHPGRPVFRPPPRRSRRFGPAWWPALWVRPP